MHAVSILMGVDAGRLPSHWKLWLPDFCRKVPFHVEAEYEEVDEMFAYRSRLPRSVRTGQEDVHDPMQDVYVGEAHALSGAGHAT